MSYLDVPEWEIEEAIVRNPSLLDLKNYFKNSSFVGHQVYLEASGRFIDLLFKADGGRYIIVELKKNYINDITIITEQVLPYRDELANQLGIPPKQVSCILATTKNFSDEVEKLCRNKAIFFKVIDQKRIYNSLPSKSNRCNAQKAGYRLFQRRYPQLSASVFNYEKLFPELAESIYFFIKNSKHDQIAKKQIAKTFKKISSKAPLCAHEVSHVNYDKFENDSNRWFWLFYSVLDRRANASTFIKAASILKKENIFYPELIVKKISTEGIENTINLIRNILYYSDFPLGQDSSRYDFAMPTSIVEAALWYSKYNFSFENVRNYFEKKYSKQERTTAFLKEVKKNIYGVGDRISGQILRGFILKDDWDWNCNIHSLLEKCNFNLTFASYPRLGLIEKEEEYCEELSSFADIYLNGNYCIVSHVLWFIRKRYCLQPKKCFECPLSGFCNYYYRSLFWQLGEHDRNLFDLL